MDSGKRRIISARPQLRVHPPQPEPGEPQFRAMARFLIEIAKKRLAEKQASKTDGTK